MIRARVVALARVWMPVILAVLALGAGSLAQTQAPPTDAGWQAFWRAGSVKDALKDAERLLKAGVTFEDAYARLETGRVYPMVAPGERSMRGASQGGTAYDNVLEVPAEYDPAKPWPLRVQLHGGVVRQDPEEGRRRRGNRIPGEPQLIAHPFAWGDSAWWHATQLDNILSLVDRIKRQFNVDESKVYLTGTSDGGTGTYYIGMREPTLWSAYLPLIGHMGVLANPTTGAEGDLFLTNLMNRPLFVVNGFRDPLYPAARMAPYIESLQATGATVIFRPQPMGGHDTSWWGGERALYERFVHDHPRSPHPALLSWETERVDRYNRIQWLVIDELGVRPSDVALLDANTTSERFEPEFGLRGDQAKEQGTRVVQVFPNSHAATMGIKVGDKILEMDGRRVTDMAGIIAAFERNQGPTITFTVQRGTETMTLSGPFPPQPTRGPAKPLFSRKKPSGRVDVLRKGNRIEARTRGVARFTLLLSPDVLDFARPVVVTVNGTTVHDTIVTKDVATLLTWAARDNDRTMLYGAALSLAVP